jgi:hypothetical protein
VFATGVHVTVFALKDTAVPPLVSEVGVPPTRLSMPTLQVKLVVVGVELIIQKPSKRGVFVEKYWMITSAFVEKPCGEAVLTVRVCPERAMPEIFAVTRPSVAAPVVVVPAVEAAVQPPLLSHAMTL